MSLKLALACAAALGLAAPALAAPAAEIRIGDLDLSRTEGFARLSRRIDRAADEICGTVPGVGQHRLHRTCRIRVALQAHAQLRDRITQAPVRLAQR